MTGILAAVGARLAKTVAVILLIATVNFMLVHAAPGDPALVIAGQSGATDQKFLDTLRAEYGLDRPVAVQLGTYLGKVVRFDLGFSYRQQRPVLDLILERLPATLLLTLTAFSLALLGGTMLGLVAGTRAGRWSDTAVTIVSLVLYATPIFWLGLILVLIFSVRLGWLPAFGYETVGGGMTGFARVLDILRHLVLPAATLGFFYLAVYARLMRASIIEVSHQDYVKTARAKGLTETQVIRRHMLRNALLPVITIAGVQAGTLVGGSIVVETVFAWPGLGRLIFEAVIQRDYPVLLGIFLVLSILVIAFNILTDILYRIVDPRIGAVR
ncbi:MAG TPA: ABC transporter permease [Microvirga sp.]|jgi:peptide/nickel transport system permease protein|nr:ABC transporter permease [Microvirga sp.]